MRKFATLGCSLFAIVHVNAKSCDSGKACPMEEDQSALLQSMKGLEAKTGKKEKELLSPSYSPMPSMKRNMYCTGTSGGGMSQEDARRQCNSKGSECPAIYEPGNDPGRFFLCPSDTTYMSSSSGSTVYPMDSSSSTEGRRRRRRSGKGKGKGEGKSKGEGKEKHYCKTMATDFRCYKTGLPECCNDNIKGNCPELQPPCEVGPSYGSPSPSYAPDSRQAPSYGGDDDNDYDSDDDDYDSDSSSYSGNHDSYTPSNSPSPPSYGSPKYGGDRDSHAPSYPPSPPNYGGNDDSYASSHPPSPPSYGGGSTY